MILSIFDSILYFNHQIFLNKQIKHLFNKFKPLSIYTAQLLIEKELTIIQLLLKIRKKQNNRLIIDDLNRYFHSYPIPCRL